MRSYIAGLNQLLRKDYKSSVSHKFELAYSRDSVLLNVYKTNISRIVLITKISIRFY